MRQFLILVGIIAVVVAALLLSLYILNWMKLQELSEDLRKIFGILGICTAAGLLIMFLVKAAEKK